PTFCSSPMAPSVYEPFGHSPPAPLLFHGTSRSKSELTALPGGQCEQILQARAQRAGVAVRERDEVRAAGRQLGGDAGPDLAEARVIRDDRQDARGRGLRSDHAERLGEDRGDDARVAQRKKVDEVAVLERAG